MKLNAKFASTLLLALYGLCAGSCTSAQIEAARILKTAHDTLDTYNGCVAPIEANPRYARIYEKLGLAKMSDPQRDPSNSQLADTERPSDADIALILEGYADLQQCNLPIIEALLKIDPAFQIYLTKYQSEVTDILHEIVTDKPTFGYVNSRILQFHLEQRSTVKQLGQTIRTRLLSEHQQDLQDRQIIAELATDALLTLATKQLNLARARKAFVASHPIYRISTIRTISCNPNIKAAVDTAYTSAKAAIISNYAARGLNTDPRQNNSLAAELASAQDQALIASVSAACSF
jgi:hypothetical protein